MKVYVVGKDTDYANWLPDCQLVSSIQAADLVLFTGGEDVYPGLYNEPVGYRTHYNIQRDLKEVKEFKEAVARDKFILGICRGSQLCCVLSGGRLVQDQKNPGYSHQMVVSENDDVLQITSTHHQAQYPYDMPKDQYKVLAYTEGLCERHLDGTDKEISDKPFKEVEICYYPKTKALGIQGHPEYVYGNKHYSATFNYLYRLIDKLLTNTL